MKILELNNEGQNAVPTPECMQVKAFRRIIDEAESRDLAVKELAYVYHMADVNSPYNQHGEDERAERIIQDMMPEGWQPRNPRIQEAIEKYNEINTGPLEHLLRSAYNSIHKAREVLEEYDFMEVEWDDEGNAHKKLDTMGMKRVFGVYSDLPSLVEGISDLREQVKREQTEGRSKTRSDVDVDPVFND